MVFHHWHSMGLVLYTGSTNTYKKKPTLCVKNTMDFNITGKLGSYLQNLLEPEEDVC